MVNPLINDGNLIGFWPLLEPSGSALFSNYSPHLANKPSGLSFDMMVHSVISDASVTASNEEETRTRWPGSADYVLTGTSGGPYVPCFKGMGAHTIQTEHGKVLIAGEGGQTTRGFFLSARAAQSGFTVGGWFLPQSNGRLDRVSPRAHAKAHSLITLSEEDNGWMIGISGSLSQPAQIGTILPGNPSGLAAFVVGLHNNTVANTSAFHLNTPIESGRFVHLAITYRVTAAAAANADVSYVLYKDGRVAASGSTAAVLNAATLTLSNSTNLAVRALCIGGSPEETTRIDRYSHATGWGHLMSGVYFFNRVLHEGEILAMHNAGGLQPFEGTPPREAKSVSLFDSKLLASLPFFGPGHVDVSKNHYAFLGDDDEGDESAGFVATSGPFRKRALENYAGTAIGLAATSGLMSDMIANKSFTIAGYFSLENDANAAANAQDFANSIACSLGEVGTLTTTVLNTSCFILATQNTNVRYLARFFPLGLSTTEATELRGFESNPFSQVATHLAVVYDDQTFGVALYVNGELQQSGTLPRSLNTQFTKCATSGYPLIFGNGIQTNILADPTTPYVSPDATKTMHDLCVFGRPLLPAEVLFLAQSGIDSMPLFRTVHDPRLMGYWRANTLDAQTLVVPDAARVWDQFPANLVRSTNDPTWDGITPTTDAVGQGAWYRRDEFSRRYAIPAALASQLPLGITSGVWTVNGGGVGIDWNDAVLMPNRNSSVANLIRRFKPVIEERDLQSTTPHSYILSYEVTPSGNIRAHTVATPVANTGQRFNCLLHTDGQEATTETFYSYLTNNAHVVGQNPGTSGVTVVFAARDGATTFTNLASGNLPFGVPSRVLFYMNFDSPYYLGDANGNPIINIRLFINGSLAYARTSTANNARIWSDGTNNSLDDHILQFGGVAGDSDNTTKILLGETGLGEIYLRNMFVMKGFLSYDDAVYFATSGIINDPVFTAYTNEQVTTPVDVNDTNLQGYYRFAGAVSGEHDLSTKQNHLTPLARIFETNNPPSFPNRDNPAQNLRFVPGPLLASDLGVQSSGITFNGNAFATTVGGWIAPPYVASGAPFTRPDLGFAVGFWYAKRETFAVASGFMPIVSYGTMPTLSTVPLNGVDYNRSWAIVWDTEENLRMVISQSGTGSMYMNPTTVSNAISGVVNCGLFSNRTGGGFGSTQNPIISNFNVGLMRAGHIDCWNHVLWSYDATTRFVTCYHNGNQVDRQSVSSGVNNPVDPTTRMISLFVPQVAPWLWMNAINNNDVDTVLTDLCYFSAPITAAQARYIAFNGIDSATGTETSGIVGGFVHGQDTGSGKIGGWFRGHDSASGLIGGYSPGATLGSGMVGGYVSGIVFAEGTLGGFMRGMDTGSGIIAGFIIGSNVGSGRIGGYVRALNTGSGLAGAFVMGGFQGSGSFGGYIPASAPGSGVVGGFITGGLQGFFSFDSSYTVEVLAAKDFDSQLEIAKTTTADFDAKLIIFQDEAPPLVAIEIPSSTVTGLVPPFNQYFIGRASGTQGKTITQTRWNFGDFTPPVAGSLSGTSYYPIQHRFAGSGFYIVKFEAIDSNGLHASDTRIINAASGVDPVIITMSGVPRSGNAALIVDFDTNVDILPPGVSIIAQLLNFDDGQTTTAFDPTHAYTEPGTYKPIWMVRDSRGIIWCDGLKMGSDILTGSED